jgi:rhomboid protease GluP
MHSKIYIKLETYFKELEYQKIPTDSENVCMYATFQKNSLYLINLIELSHNYVFDKAKYMQYREFTKKQFVTAKTDKVILINLMLVPDIDMIYKDVNYTPDVESKFIDIHWIIDTTFDEFIIPKKQLNNAIGLEKKIKQLVETDTSNMIKIHKRNKAPVVTAAMIVINIIVWLLLELSGGSTDASTLLKYGALYTPYVTENGEVYRLLTSTYIHIGASHLFFNCVSIYIFGTRLEKYMSWFQYLFIYTFSGIAGGCASMIGSMIFSTQVISAGASGSIYGVIGSILVCSNFSGKSIDGLNGYNMSILFLIGIIYGIVNTNVDILAHVGGFLGGILITIILLMRKKSVAL